MKYFVKYKKGLKCSNAIHFENKSMFITCNDIERAWYEYKKESNSPLILIDITPLPN